MSRQQTTSPATVELLFFEGCPSHERLLPTVERLADEAGAELRVREIATPEIAETERFLGSPTVRVDGVDVEPGAGARDDFGLKCRIYRSAEGQAGVPPEAWIRTALERSGRTVMGRAGLEPASDGL